MFGVLRFANQQLIKSTTYSNLPPLYVVGAKAFSSKISQSEVCAVKKSWKALQKKAPKLASDFFSGLFKAHPDYSKLFSKFGACPEEILGNDCFIKDHAVGNVLVTFGKAVNKLDDPCEVDIFVKEVGKRHIKYCMKAEYFTNAIPIFLKAVEKNACDLDCDARKGWEKTVNMVMNGLAKGLKST